MKFERLARVTVYESTWVNLYLDTVRFPNGLVVEPFHLLDFNRAAVAALVENDAGELAFARVPRYTTGKAEWELPAGGMESGESIEATAHREVLEEIGVETHAHCCIYSFHPMVGNANKVSHLVYCRAGKPNLRFFDHGEVSEVCWKPRAEIQAMIQMHHSVDGLTLTGLLFWLAGFHLTTSAA